MAKIKLSGSGKRLLHREIAFKTGGSAGAFYTIHFSYKQVALEL